MTALSFWAASDLDAASWDSVWLGDSLIPGICTVTAEVGRALDEQKSKGTDGAYLADHGNVLGKVTISVLIYTADQWTAWQNVVPKIKQSKSGGTHSPLEILHPEANLLGIKTVYVKTIKGEPPSSKSGKRYTIECMEWVAKPKTPTISKVPQTTAQQDGPAAGVKGLDIPQTPDITKAF